MSIIRQVRRRRREGNASGSAPMTSPTATVTSSSICASTDVVSSSVCPLVFGATSFVCRHASSAPIYAPFATVSGGVFYSSNNVAFAASAHCTAEASSLSTTTVTSSSMCTNVAAASLPEAPTKLQVQRTRSKDGEVFSAQESQTFAIWTE